MPDIRIRKFAGSINSPNPFWLASAPPTNTGEMIMRAFDAGWDDYREKALVNQIKMGVCPAGTKLSPRDEFVPEWAKLTKQEKERLEGTLHGQWWVTANGDGRLHFSPTREPIPPPTADESMMPFWSPCDTRKTRLQMELLDPRQTWPPFSPSIMIQSLCGYGYTSEGYRYQAERLESWGFFCLRSRRDDDGKFWEIWFLPGLWFAKGELREICPDTNATGALDKAVSFLCRNASFGSLDVVVQRAAMTIDGPE